MTQSFLLPNELFNQIMNNSLILRKSGIHPLAKLVKSDEFQDILIYNYRGFPKRPLNSGVLYQRGNRIRKHETYKSSWYYNSYYLNRMKKYKLNTITYIESIKFFNNILINFLDTDIDILFEDFNDYSWYYDNNIYDTDYNDNDYYDNNYENEYHRFS